MRYSVCQTRLSVPSAEMTLTDSTRTTISCQDTRCLGESDTCEGKVPSVTRWGLWRGAFRLCHIESTG